MSDKGAWRGDHAKELDEAECCGSMATIAIQLGAGIVLLPLHLVPVLGTVVYAGMNGAILAWDCASTLPRCDCLLTTRDAAALAVADCLFVCCVDHCIWFDMCGVSQTQQRQEIFLHWREYVRFGVVSHLLMMVSCWCPLSAAPLAPDPPP